MADEPGAPSPERSGDDPFLPEEGFFWWLPRAAAILLVLVALILLTVATIHHGKYRLVRLDDGAASLERGRFAPRGWEAFAPDGGIEAWSGVQWHASAPEPPLHGELRDLAETWLGMIRAGAADISEGDFEALEQAESKEYAFEAWYQARYSATPPAVGSIGEVRASWALARAEAEAEAEAQAQAEEEARVRAAEAAEALARAHADAADPDEALTRARSYSAQRRALLGEVERLLRELPPAGAGSPEEERDRAALETLVRQMDTPVHLIPGE